MNWIVEGFFKVNNSKICKGLFEEESLCLLKHQRGPNFTSCRREFHRSDTTTKTTFLRISIRCLWRKICVQQAESRHKIKLSGLKAEIHSKQLWISVWFFWLLQIFNWLPVRLWFQWSIGNNNEQQNDSTQRRLKSGDKVNSEAWYKVEREKKSAEEV